MNLWGHRFSQNANQKFEGFLPCPLINFKGRNLAKFLTTVCDNVWKLTRFFFKACFSWFKKVQRTFHIYPRLLIHLRQEKKFHWGSDQFLLQLVWSTDLSSHSNSHVCSYSSKSFEQNRTSIDDLSKRKKICYQFNLLDTVKTRFKNDLNFYRIEYIENRSRNRQSNIITVCLCQIFGTSAAFSAFITYIKLS